MENTKLSRKDNINPYSLSYSEAVERIIRYSAEEDQAIGYYLPAFVKTPLPHSDPGLTYTNWRRFNGKETMKLVADVDFGFPHSGRSRLLIAWMLGNLYRNYNIGRKSGMERDKLNKESRMVFQGTIQDLLCSLGYSDDVGGENGSITHVKRHLDAIINTTYKWPKNENLKNVTAGSDSFLFSMNQHIDWRQHRWDQTHSFIEITPTLLHFVHNKVDRFAPFTIALPAFRARKISRMAMDLYCWLTRKMYAILNHPKRAECHPDNPNRHKFIYSWKALQPQFGASYKAQKDFTYRAKQAIEKIERLWSHRTY